MKKKGFTLVELLAAIAILSILVIIIVPNVMNLFIEAKENSFLNEVKQIYKSARQQWVNDSLVYTNEISYGRTQDGDCTQALRLSGRKEIHYYVKINKLGMITKLYVEDGAFQYTYNGNGLNIEDIDGVIKTVNANQNNILTITCSGGNGSLISPNNSLSVDEYQEVEYIESDGTQYIDVGLKVKAGLKFEGKLYTETSNKEMAIIGNKTGLGTIEIAISNHGSFFNWAANDNQVYVTPTSITNNIFTFRSRINGNAPYRDVYIDLDGGLFHSGGKSAYSGSPVELRLFNMSSGYGYIGRTYYLKIYDNNVLVRNYIPCYRKSDHVAGLYDTVGQVFYSNDNTSGNNFTVGNDVN